MELSLCIVHFSLGLQLPGHRGGLRFPHLHIRWLRHRIPQDPPCAEGAQASQSHQQGSG